MVKKPDAIDLLEAGLRGTSLRQSAIANNLANIDTPGYRRQDVQFENVLAKAMESGDAEEIKNVEMKIFSPGTGEADSTGNDVNLDAEIGELIKNTGTQKMYLRLLSRMYRQIDQAIGT
jgi:flagellar basal-body rod protein FlgB